MFNNRELHLNSNMESIMKLVLGVKLNLPKKVVGLIDGRPLGIGKYLGEVKLRELDIPAEKFKEAVKLYKERYKQEHGSEELYRDYGYIPPSMWLTPQLPNGEFAIQQRCFQRIIPENSYLHLFLKEYEEEQLLGVDFSSQCPITFNYPQLQKLPNLESILSHKIIIAEEINRYGFNFQPDDIGLYLVLSR